MAETAERITILETWSADSRTRYILRPDGTRRLLDVERLPRPWVEFKTREQIEETWPSKN